MRSQLEDDILGVSSMYVQHEPVDLDCSVDPATGEYLPSRTRQEFAAECDIGNILERYENTGIVSHINPREAVYLDCSSVPDLRTALMVVDNATEAFMSLPAKVRATFDNDPVRFVEFATNPENKAKLQEWGLAKPDPVDPPPQRVEIVNPDAVGGAASPGA